MHDCGTIFTLKVIYSILLKFRICNTIKLVKLQFSFCIILVPTSGAHTSYTHSIFSKSKIKKHLLESNMIPTNCLEDTREKFLLFFLFLATNPTDFSLWSVKLIKSLPTPPDEPRAVSTTFAAIYGNVFLITFPDSNLWIYADPTAS